MERMGGIPTDKTNLMIERDTYGQLQCHLYPREYVDSSKHCSNSAFFMGLQRKEGEVNGQQFDIRMAVDQFRHNVNMFLNWKPGMDIIVSHVRREQIPSFVFRDRRSRAPRQQPEQSFHVDESCSSGSAGRQLENELDRANVQSSFEKCEDNASPRKHDS